MSNQLPFLLFLSFRTFAYFFLPPQNTHTQYRYPQAGTDPTASVLHYTRFQQIIRKAWLISSSQPSHQQPAFCKDLVNTAVILAEINKYALSIWFDFRFWLGWIQNGCRNGNMGMVTMATVCACLCVCMSHFYSHTQNQINQANTYLIPSFFNIFGFFFPSLL